MAIPFEFKRTFNLDDGSCKWSFVIKDTVITPPIREFMNMCSYKQHYDFDDYNNYYYEFFVHDGDFQILTNFLITTEGK